MDDAATIESEDILHTRKHTTISVWREPDDPRVIVRMDNSHLNEAAGLYEIQELSVTIDDDGDVDVSIKGIKVRNDMSRLDRVTYPTELWGHLETVAVLNH